MRKLLSLCLVLALLLSAAAFAEAAPAEAGLPEVGDLVNGFALQEIRDFPLVGATVYYFEHERTGAHLMYIANEDTNRVFDLTFFTRAVDNTGLPHVFEHATLDGSKKYPPKTLFFNLSYQTYNTYMNASTYPLMTTYPVASLSEAQLLKYADYYTDSCFNPRIMEDESIFREEAWRYRLGDMDSDLTIEGTVYSEMLGAITLDSAAFYNMLRASFPGSTIGNISGGDPANIPEMTWETLRAYHDLYYHPSNCTAFLYGQFDDYAAFLQLLDEAFAPYEKREFTFEDPDYTPLEGPATQEYAFPVEASSTTEHAATVYYSFICPGLKADLDEELVLNTFTDLMNADASPLMQTLHKVLPYGEFACYIECEGPEDCIIFSAANVNAEDAALFQETVDAGLAEIAANGFDQALVDSVMANLSLSIALTSESNEVGVDLIPDIAYSYSTSGDPFNYLDYVEGLENLDEWNQQGLYAEAVTRYLTDSQTTALATTVPQPGLKEENDAAEAARLAEVKAGMTEEELQAIIDQSNAADEDEDASAYVADLQAVTVDSLPEEMRTYEINDATGEDGVRRLSAEAGVDGVGTTTLFLDASGLPQEDIHWFALYTSLVGDVDTSAHTREELAVLKTRWLFSDEIRLSLLNNYENPDDYRPCLRAGWTAMNEDLGEGYDLMYELLFDTQFDDPESLLGLIQQRKASLKSDINNGPFNASLYRAFGVTSPLYRYYSYFNYLEYYAFLEEAEMIFTEDPEAGMAKLREVQAYFHNRTNAVAAYVGDADGIAANDKLLDDFFAKFDAEPIETVAYDLPVTATREALVVDGAVQFNGVIADYATIGLEGYDAGMDAVANLVNDMYLLPKLRDQYGAYGVMHGWLTDGGSYIVSYRDPNVGETFDVYAALPAFLEELDLDQETLDGYILSSYSRYAASDGELLGGLSALLARLTNEPDDLKLQYMEQLKQVTPEAVKEYAENYANFVENGVTFTDGGAAVINANADRYDEILNPFGAKDTSEVVFEDLPEDDPQYEAVRFAYENGLMQPKDDANFGVADEATLGDLAGALYGLIGGDVSAQDEAVTTLAGYGILPADGTAADALTGAAADAVLAAFSEAVGVPYEANAEAGEEPLTRGALAGILTAYLETLE